MPKNVINPFPLLSSQSLAATFSSSPVSIQYMDNICLLIYWAATGTPIGTFTIEVSNDYNPITHVDGHWDALVLSTPLTATGAAAQFTIDMNQLGASYMRVTYTRTSGTGTANATLTAKQI